MRAPSALAMAMMGATSMFAAGGMALGGCDDDDDGAAAAAEAMSTHFDFVRRAHLADVDFRGLYVDFGTPQQDKHTVGDWESGWLSRGRAGDRTFAHVGRRARVYFNLDEAKATRVRLDLRPIGTGALTPYINGEQISSLFFEGNDFQHVEFDLPRASLQRGENQLLLTFGGVESVGGEEVSVAIASLRLSDGEEFHDEGFVAPDWADMVGETRVGDEAREAITVRAPTTLRWYMQVPEGGAHLDFGVGVDGAGQADVAVRIQPEGAGPTAVFSGRAGDSWSDQRVDLTRFGGKVVRLELEARGAIAGRVAWGRPRLLVPERAAPEGRNAKNVVVVLIDTLRADKLRPFNPRTRVRTPVLDGLASSGTVFTTAQSTENWTKPSVAGILTGLHPRSHGARTQEASLSSEAVMLSEHLKSQGFSTGSFIANGYVSDRFGFDQGWDQYRNFIREEGSSEAANVFEEAGRWATANKDDRFFLFVQTIDPHVAYDPGDEYVRMYDDRDYDGPVQPRRTPELLEDAKRGRVTFSDSDQRRLEALHDGEITQHDVELGRFLEHLRSLGVMDDTLVVIVSDHGEEFNDHGSWGHGHSIYQELLHVPFLFHMPGVVPEARVEHAVSTVSLAPTVVDLLGVAPMTSAEGQSLVTLMHGGLPNGPAIAFSDFLDERRVAVSAGWKLIVRGNLTASLFNLNADPGEEEQLELQQHPIAARYLRVYHSQFLGASDRGRWLDADQGQGARLQAGEAQMDDQLRGQLEALGYVN